MEEKKSEPQPIKREIPFFKVGDTIKVYQTVIEGENKRTQIFEGIVIAKKGTDIRETFTARKLSYGIGVERTYPVYSPLIEKNEIVRRVKVRRAKLYYLREKTGKEAILKDRKSIATEEKKWMNWLRPP